MNQFELLHDQASLERGDELIRIMQESFSEREEFNKQLDDRNNHFVNTAIQLSESAMSRKLNGKAYKHLGHAFISAKQTQDQYDAEREIADINSPLFNEDEIYDLLYHHGNKPVAACLVDQRTGSIYSHRKFEELNPNMAKGYLGKFEFDESERTSKLHLIGRLSAKKTTYSIRVLHESTPQVKLAIGE